MRSRRPRRCLAVATCLGRNASSSRSLIRFAKIKEKADVVEASAIFEAGKLAEERIDWRAASAYYARAARLQPSNWQYAQRAGTLAQMMGDYATAASFKEATLSLVNSALGPDAP